ncbi:hypothetical protein Tco_1426508 [Tanacetum coccineum]
MVDLNNLHGLTLIDPLGRLKDANEKHLIQVLKIHTDENVADLLTKAFDGPRFNYLPTKISSDDAVASQVSADGTQDPAGVTISSIVAATRTPDVSAKSSSTSPLPASFSAASTTPPSTNLSPPPPAAVTDTTTTSLPAEPNPANPVGAVPTDETQDVSTPAAQTISSPSSTGQPKWRKRTAKKCTPKPLLDMDDQSFIKFDFGSESESDLVPWAAIAAWEVLSTPLGEINALYRIDGVTKHFMTLREILHMVDRQDLMKLYGIVDKFYQTTIATGIQRISLTGFPAQSVGSSNTDVLDSPCLLVLITRTSQSRQHVNTSLIHIESCKSPTAVLFDVDTRRMSHPAKAETRGVTSWISS